MKTKYTCILIAAFVVITYAALLTQNTSKAQTSLFSDNFEDGNASDWTRSSGSWSIVTDGSLVYRQSGTSADSNARIGSSAWANYSIQARVKVTGFNGSDRYAGIMARVVNSNHYYFLALQNGNRLLLGKRVGGSPITLASKAFTYSLNTFYTLRLDVSGSNLTAYVDGVQQLTAVDTSFPSGFIGGCTYYASANFDDFLVTSTSPTPTPTPTPMPTPTPTPTPTPSPEDLYVAPNGSALNAGTISSPTTLESAITRIASGNTIYMRGGIYTYLATIIIQRDNSGISSSSPKRIFAYSGENPILDFYAQSFSSSNRGLQVFSHYWHLKGLEVRGAGDNGIFIGGNYNTVERCITHHNRDSGIQISRYNSGAGPTDWPSYNLVLNCTSFDNFDTDNGEDADGFACKLTTGPGNVFRGCVAYHNADDGYDLYTKSDTGPIGAVLIEYCIAYNNGFLSDGTTPSAGDGNGYKLGGEGIPVNHTLRRSLAWNNRKHGITYNNNPGSIIVENNTSWDNAERNFNFDAGTHIFRNNLSFQSGSSDRSIGTDVQSTNCMWINNASANGKGLVVSASDFLSLVPYWSRNADGSINTGNFLKLVSGSDLVNAGTSSGIDIGAIESW